MIIPLLNAFCTSPVIFRIALSLLSLVQLATSSCPSEAPLYTSHKDTYFPPNASFSLILHTSGHHSYRPTFLERFYLELSQINLYLVFNM